MARDAGDHEIVDGVDLVRYLYENFVTAEEDTLTRAVILAALNTPFAKEAIANGQKMGSFVYYVGDQIAGDRGWVAMDDDDDEEIW